jgi:DNA-binding response OmpR family regulator
MAPAHVLVADPDRLQLQLIDMLLAGEGFETTLVDSGKAALEHLKEATPDLCLLAMDLPDVAGDVICGKVRRVSRLARTPVVLVAPQAGRFGLSDDARRRARRAGADLILPRPLGDKNLRERLQGVLDQRETTPDREGFSTAVIEEALEEIPVDSDSAGAPPGATSIDPATSQNVDAVDEPRSDPDAVAERSDAAGTDRESAEAKALHARHGPHAEMTPSVLPGDDAGHEAASTLRPEEVARLRKELEILRVENAQLKRKLKQKQEQIERGVNPALERTIADLERRNHALLAQLEKYENDADRGGGGGGGGLFGRRS